MNIKLIFTDWVKDGKSVYQTEEGVALSMGQLHSGSAFEGTINIPDDEYSDLHEALKMGYQPVFRVISGRDK